jgi:hypothetical protein
MERACNRWIVRTLDGGVGALLLCAPVIAVGQAASPFMTGATALQTNILAWLTPIAIIFVIVLIDDVITKGRTVLAAAARLQAVFPHADIRAFALIRTVGFRQRMDCLIEPCDGVVRWAGGDARRDP